MTEYIILNFEFQSTLLRHFVTPPLALEEESYDSFMVTLIQKYKNSPSKVDER